MNDQIITGPDPSTPVDRQQPLQLPGRGDLEVDSESKSRGPKAGLIRSLKGCLIKLMNADRDRASKCFEPRGLTQTLRCMNVQLAAAKLAYLLITGNRSASSAKEQQHQGERIMAEVDELRGLLAEEEARERMEQGYDTGDMGDSAADGGPDGDDPDGTGLVSDT